MKSILVHPADPPADLVRTLELAGWEWHGFDHATDAIANATGEGYAIAVVAAPSSEDSISFCRALRAGLPAGIAVLLLVGGRELDTLDAHTHFFEDFSLLPCHPAELEARLRHLLTRTGGLSAGAIIEHGGLILNTETYQAAMEGRPLDLTHMEYELLRYLASSPGKVFTRETLLSQVWGYDYFGGARTVDVHVRRLRAKLGEEHAALIQTVRSVGYSFGESTWQP